MENEPKRNHYIPQFILRKFCDSKGQLLYLNSKEGTIQKRNPKSVFVVSDLYRDEFCNPSQPTRIESDLALFEEEISRIIAGGGFYQKEEISLTTEEYEKLSIFFSLMDFRAKKTRDIFINTLSESSRRLYSINQERENLEEFWKINLGELAKCRTISQISSNQKINELFRVNFVFETVDFFMSVIERRGPEDFLLGDIYPTFLFGLLDQGLRLPVYRFFPISPSRMIVFTSAKIHSIRKEVRFLSDNISRAPIVNSGRMVFHVRKLYCNDVVAINAMALNEVIDGCVAKESERIKRSLLKSKFEKWISFLK